MLLAGCGLAANPQPPTLWLPAPVKDVTAVRVADEVHLHWTMPKETTDKVTLKGDQRAHICREDVTETVTKAAPPPPVKPGTRGNRSAAPVPPPGFDAQACQTAGDGMFAPGQPAEITVKMPAELLSGAPRAVSYYVELENRAGKTAGPSNAALVVTGAAPAGVMNLRLAAQAGGVVLRWEKAAPQPAPQPALQSGTVLRIHRELVPAPGAPKANQSAGVPVAPTQVLEVDLDGEDPGVALDHDAQLDHAWKYWVERVARVKIGEHTLEVAGLPSETVTIDAKDVFPPAVPAGLAAVVDAEAKAIALSWAPDAEADLAGYVVYRRDMTAGTEMRRISPQAPVVPPAFNDTGVVAGHRYAYAVSAVDRDGNESARSGEVEEEMPE